VFSVRAKFMNFNQ